MSDSGERMLKNTFSLYRLEALTDGVFAIVMTLLVLGLSIPVFKESSMQQGFTQLLEMWPKFACYFVTFLLLGYMWIANRVRWNFIKGSDSGFCWLNIIFLMFTSLLPFSTSLLAENIGQQLPLLVYEGNSMACSLAAYLGWLYATGRSRLVDRDINSAEVRMFITNGALVIIVNAIAMGIAFLSYLASIGIIVVAMISTIIYNTLRYRARAAD